MGDDLDPAELDLAAAISGLDRATKDFTRRLSDAQEFADRAAAIRGASVPPSPSPDPPSPAAGLAPPVPEDRLPTAEEVYAERLREAEREARLYLEQAKRRADSLVATMIEAVEQEAEAIRLDAEQGMRERWGQVEADARRHLEEAVRVGDGIVAERQQRLETLSERITGSAEALSAGLEDADRIRVQFEAFVRALALTSDRIAQQSQTGSGLEVQNRPSAIAA